jgi:hypothetical protein
MGNWQLSVFYFQSAPAGMEPSTAMWVGITTSFISNAVMIVIFYMIHKYYWQPHRRGEPAFGGIFLRIQNYIHDHDFERKPVQSTITVAVLFIFIVSGIILGATVSMGVIPPSADEPAVSEVADVENWIVSEEVITGSSHLEEPDNETLEAFIWEEEKYIKSVTVTITWTDEPDIRLRYQNQPDTFELSIDGPIYSDEARAANTQGGQGSISAQISYSNDETSQIFADLENPQINISVQLIEAGNQETNIGFTYYEDSGNDYNYEIIVEWLAPEEA